MNWFWPRKKMEFEIHLCACSMWTCRKNVSRTATVEWGLDRIWLILLLLSVSNFCCQNNPVKRYNREKILCKSCLTAQETNFIWLRNQNIPSPYYNLSRGFFNPNARNGQRTFLMNLFCPKDSYAIWMIKFPKIAISFWNFFGNDAQVPWGI